jgi:hypothetical protein
MKKSFTCLLLALLLGTPSPDDILIQVCGSFSADFVYICKLLKY